MSASPTSAPIPVSLLTGFLGSGKTTLLNQLLQLPELKETLVLINEFGEIGIDHDLVSSGRDGVVVEMSSGCLCCTIRGDLVKTLRDATWRFARGGKARFNRVIVESTGLADPAPILHTLMAHPSLSKAFRLDGVLTTVDAVNAMTTLDRHVESVKQAAVADRLILTKTDLVDAGQLAQLEARLHALNPAATQLHASDGQVDTELLFNLGLYNPKTKSLDVQRWLNAEAYAARDADAENPHHAHRHDVNRHDAHIRAFCFWVDEPFEPDALEAWLGTLLSLRGPDLLRVKGIVNVIGYNGPMVIHGVQDLFHPPMMLPNWPSSERRTRVVFIVRDIAEHELRELLACVRNAPQPAYVRP